MSERRRRDSANATVLVIVTADSDPHLIHLIKEALSEAEAAWQIAVIHLHADEDSRKVERAIGRELEHGRIDLIIAPHRLVPVLRKLRLVHLFLDLESMLGADGPRPEVIFGVPGQYGVGGSLYPANWGSFGRPGAGGTPGGAFPGGHGGLGGLLGGGYVGESQYGDTHWGMGFRPFSEGTEAPPNYHPGAGVGGGWGIENYPGGGATGVSVSGSNEFGGLTFVSQSDNARYTTKTDGNGTVREATMENWGPTAGGSNSGVWFTSNTYNAKGQHTGYCRQVPAGEGSGNQPSDANKPKGQKEKAKEQTKANETKKPEDKKKSREPETGDARAEDRYAMQEFFEKIQLKELWDSMLNGTVAPEATDVTEEFRSWLCRQGLNDHWHELQLELKQQDETGYAYVYWIWQALGESSIRRSVVREYLWSTGNPIDPIAEAAYPGRIAMIGGVFDKVSGRLGLRFDLRATPDYGLAGGAPNESGDQ